MNLKAVISQRLVPAKTGGRVPAVEVMLNTSYISELIRDGRIHGLREAMTRGSRDGMQTFDQSLFDLYKRGEVELHKALDNADSRTDLEWRINFGGGVPSGDSEGTSGAFG